MRLQQVEGAEQRREHASAVDVADQQHGRVGHAGHRHVDDVAVTEVDLGRAPGTFDDHQVEGAAQTREALGDEGKEPGLHSRVLAPGDAGDRPSQHHELRSIGRLGLEENRIHADGGLDSRGRGLAGLGPSDLAAVHCDGRVQRHVLSLERRDAIACARKEPAEGRGEQALADARGGALNHEARSKDAHFPNRTLTPARNA